MVGSIRSCVADRQTDGAGYIGPAEGQGGSKNFVGSQILHTHRTMIFLPKNQRNPMHTLQKTLPLTK